MELLNKIILLTGGSKGIGKTVARHYLNAGARIVLTARNLKDLETTAGELDSAGNKILPLSLDVTDLSQVEKIFKQAESHWGPIDILHNNAGIHRGFGPFWLMNPQEWKDDIEVNLTGSYNCSRVAAEEMVKRKKGIILTTLGGGVKDLQENMAAYSVSKTGLLKLTEIMAKELTQYNISVFGLFPGLIDTPGNQEKISRAEVQKWIDLEDALEKYSMSADPLGELSVKLASGEFNHLSGMSFYQWENPAEFVKENPAGESS